ncbi:sensor histidine kinase [Agrococcus sp. Marseille-P2731]|uniref:sensor histidine kinase n=1 Tax=Agrococcus sp. Marseille-P2731 TaxID=1841862 RepID=UPI00093054A4|nr:histidine kinase [Agrococcus sp. Marseille-P2731]
MLPALARTVSAAFVTLPISRRARIALTVCGALLLLIEGVALLLRLEGSSWESLLWVVASSVVVVVAAWWPTVGALLTLAFAFASSALDSLGTFQFGIAIVAAIIARTCSASFMAMTGFVYIAWAALAPGGGLANLTSVLLTSFSALVGAVLRAAARRSRELEGRLTAQESLRRAALAAERSRIAVEMHDVVAHALTVIAMHSSVLERSEDPEQRRSSQRAIGEVSRRAVEDMRTMLSALHDEGGAADGSASGALVAEPEQLLEALASSLRTAGIPTELRAPIALELPSPLMLAVVRIAQEATTNILKHAPGSVSATITITVLAEAVVVEVENTLPVLTGPSAPPSGFGLLGLHERTKLFGGALRTGWQGDTWRVRAELPLDPESNGSATSISG